MSAYAPNPTYNSNEDNYAPLTASLLARKGEAMPAVDATAHAGVDIDLAPTMAGMEAGAAAGRAAQRRRSVKAAQRRRPDAPRPETVRAEAARPEPVRYAEADNDFEPPAPQAEAEYLEDDYNPVAYAPNEGGGDAVVDAEPAPAGYATPDDEANIERFPGAAQPSSPVGENWTISGPSIDDPMDAFPEGVPTDGASLENVKARLRRRVRKAAEAGKAGRKATITFRMPARDLVRLRFASRELGVMCQAIILEALECYLEANDVAPVSDADFAAETDRLIRLKKEKSRKRSG